MQLVPMLSTIAHPCAHTNRECFWHGIPAAENVKTTKVSMYLIYHMIIPQRRYASETKPETPSYGAKTDKTGYYGHGSKMMVL
jgi:hypothetical protein